MLEVLIDVQLVVLDEVFNLIQFFNNEIVYSWLMIVVNNNYELVYECLYSYLVLIGCNKLVKLLYQVLLKIVEGKVFVKKVFEEVKLGYYLFMVRVNEGFVEQLFEY